MIVSIYLEEHEYLTNKPQTLNFGGKYLYTFFPVGKKIVIRRKLNEKYIEDFFNISEGTVTIELLSAIVGQNGVGKSSMLDIFRKPFVEHIHSMPYNTSTILIEVEGETKVLFSNKPVYLASDFNMHDRTILTDYISDKIPNDQYPNAYTKLEEIQLQTYQSIYYSPHFDLKYNSDFDEVDQYDISLDQFIKLDLADLDNKGTNENGFRFELHNEMAFKNALRQIEFLDSSIFKENVVFRKVFDLPQYETGILHFREVDIPDFHNTPMPLQPIIELILKKTEQERANWHVFRDKNSKKDDKKGDAMVRRYMLERFIIRAFMSVVIQQMEKKNTWLNEGKIQSPYDLKRFEKLSAYQTLLIFMEESYIEKGKFKKSIFNYTKILPFFEKINSLLSDDNNLSNIQRQSIRLNLDQVKEVLALHRNIILNLLHYYPKVDGLIDRNNYTDGFISFSPTDKNLSSGENALLNFFSKFYSFIQNNLVEISKSLPDKNNYIILLDEADLGFHPVWKKRYVDALLKTVPHFFECLEVKPRLQIVITTHDALTLSDFPSTNVVFLQKDDNYCTVVSEVDKNKIHKTFGANITDLLAHSFFVENGLIGDFSKSKIKSIIDWINENKKLPAGKKTKQKFQQELTYYKKAVSLIDEKIVKIKLMEMITELVPDNTYFNQIIDKEIELLQRKKR